MPTEKNLGRIIRKYVWILTAALFALTAVASAQLYTGSIAGNVTDQTGAVIPGVKITAIDADKGFSFTATTDQQGNYLLRQIPPGNYNITAESSNFQGQRKDGVTISINENA